MPIDWQTIDIKFTEGQDTRTNPKLVVPGKWRSLVNMTTSVERTPKMRDGLETLASTIGHGLFLRDSELLVVNGPLVTSISTGASAGFATTGNLGYVGISKTEIRRTSGFQTLADCDSGNGFTCYVWQERSTTGAALLAPAKLTLVDESTGTHIIDAATLYTPTGGEVVDNLRVIYSVSLSAFFVFYRASPAGTATMFCRVILKSAPSTLGAQTALIASANLAGLNWDACLFAGSPCVYYAWGDGITSTRVIRVTTTGTTPSISFGPTNITAVGAVPAAAITALACCAFSTDATALLLVQSTGAVGFFGVAGTTINTSAVVVAGPNPLDPTVGVTTSATHLAACQESANIRVFYDYISERDTSVTVGLRSMSISTAFAITSGPVVVAASNCFAGAGNPRGQRGPWIHGKPYVAGGRVLLPVCVESVDSNASLSTSNPRTANAQNTFFVLDTGATGSAISVGTVAAVALRGAYGVASINANPPPVGTPCNSPQVSSGVFATLAGELTLLVVTSSANNISPTGLVRLTMTPNTASGLSRAQLGESSYVASGSLSAYDGSSVVEHGFELYPEGVSIVANAAGTGSVTDGTHQLCVIYEWIDNAGQRHQSAPSPAIQIATAGGPNTTSYTVRVPTLQLTQKTGISVVVFMTQAGGTTFTRTGIGQTVIQNDKTFNFVSVTVNNSDASIAFNEQLYNQPNNSNSTLANIAPGPCSTICVAHNRLWFDMSDQQNAFGFSQEYENNVGLKFANSLGDRYDANGGKLQTISFMDEKIILLCARKLFVIFGQGPQSSGAFGTYTKPEEIQSDVGCVDPRSVLKVPSGIIFKTAKGMYMLGRELSVKYVGEGVAYTATGQAAALATTPIQAAVMLEDRQECRFVVNSSGTYVFALDYLDGQWAEFQASGVTPNFSDAVWWPTLGAVVYATKSGGIVRDKDGKLFDDVLASQKGISWSALTNFIHLSAMDGFQRVRRFLLSGSALVAPTGALQFQVFYDDEIVTPSYSGDVDFSGIITQSLNAIDIRHRFQNQKCKSVALKFIWNFDAFVVPPPMTGIQALALEIGIKRGVNRLPAGQTVA